MTAATIPAKLLLVEDERKIRTDLEKVLQRTPFSFDVRAPRSLGDTINQLLLERSDGGMFDTRLDRWGIGKDKSVRVNGHVIRNGIDIAALYREINENAPVGFHSSFLDEDDVREQIDSLAFK